MGSTRFLRNRIFFCKFNNRCFFPYYNLRSFRREITAEKMGVTSAERYRCLEIIQKIVYSKSSDGYKRNVQQLVHTMLTVVSEYFMKNWDPIKHQWVSSFKDLCFNLGETTYNRLESTFNKLKSVCTKHTGMLQFFMEFFAFLGAIRNDRNHQHLMSLTRREIVSPNNPDMAMYNKYLTAYAFSIVKSQFEKMKERSSYDFERCETDESYTLKCANSSSIKVSKNNCGCHFMSKIGLPCQHIMKLRSFSSLAVFDTNIVNRRWTKEYYNLSLGARNCPETSPKSVELIMSETDRTC